VNNQAFVPAALAQLRQWFVEVRPDPAADVVMLDDGRFGPRTYRLVVVPSLTQVSAATLTIDDDLPVLVITTFIGEAIGAVLRDRGIDYVDAVGNARLAWDSVLVDVRGRRAGPTPRPRPEDRAARAFSRSGVQVVFALLAWPELTARPLRAIAAAAGVSLGSAKIVMDELVAGRYVYRSDGVRHLAHGKELLSRWAEAYSISLFPKLQLGRFSGGQAQWWRDPSLLEAGVQLGGEAASELVDPYLRSVTVTLYADTPPLRLLIRHRLRRDEDGEVSVRRRFWTPPDGGPVEALVPLPLIYADLLATGEPRQREHAQRLRGNDARLQRIDDL
jgi:hypothetical protein